MVILEIQYEADIEKFCSSYATHWPFMIKALQKLHTELQIVDFM